MRILFLIYLSLIVLSASGCYLPINGRVVDAETNAPIEGAVVMVEWTKTHGIGDHSTESYKVIEVVSDKEGKVKIEGCYSLMVNPPDVTVYKRGYVAWSSRIIFPNSLKRTDFSWMNQFFKLERFKANYSHIEHTAFISSAIRSTIGIKTLINNAYDWEEKEASKERDKRRNKNQEVSQ